MQRLFNVPLAGLYSTAPRGPSGPRANKAPPKGRGWMLSPPRTALTTSATYSLQAATGGPAP